MKTRPAVGLLLFVCLPSVVFGDPVVNSWMKPTSGYWEEQAYWSLGVLPDATQSVVFTNEGWKALAIGPNTAQSFPQSMQIQGLQIAGPTNSYNVLLLNYSGFEVPLQVTSLTVGSNSSVVALSSMLSNSGSSLLQGGSIQQGDFAQVTVQGPMRIWSPGVFINNGAPPAAYYLTNGTLSVNSYEYIGGMSGAGQFIQYGGEHNAGSITVGPEGEFDLYDGQLTVTNGIVAGGGDYADAAYFYQYGGNVNADMSVGGNYNLYGGTVRGHFTMALNERSDGYVTQSGGTNSATSMELGQVNEFGGGAFYTLSNGVIHVDSSVRFGGGYFKQYGGQNTIVSNLVMYGITIEVGPATAEYFLDGGTLSVGGLTTELNSTFHQNGGTNYVAGDLVTVAAPPAYFLQTDEYNLAGGFLSAKNEVVNGAVWGGFVQSGGYNQISDQLTVQGFEPDAYFYTLEGGTLAVRDIYVSAGASFQHTSGNIIQSGVLTLDQGEWRAATGEHALGPLHLASTQNTNPAAITFTNGSSILRLANSSAQPWVSGANLYITNWHGSVSGGGATQLYFGNDSSGLTPQQLAQIRFVISGSTYPATILTTGEVVPVGAGSTGTITYTRNGNTLTLTWPQGWTLQSATNVTGPYQDVSGATNTYNAPMNLPSQFFRLRQ